MKTVIEYRYTGFTVFRMWGHAGSVWLWAMDHEELADATLYKGSMRTTHAYDKRIEGSVFEGFHDWRGSSAYLSQYLQYQRCVNDVDTEWFCLHGHKCKLVTKYLQLNGRQALPENYSCLVLEGNIDVDYKGSIYHLRSMHNFKARSLTATLEGVGKAFIIKQDGPPPSVKAPFGITSSEEAMSALRAITA